jgi:hypothetical protein
MHMAMMESDSLCVRMKSWLRFWNLSRQLKPSVRRIKANQYAGPAVGSSDWLGPLCRLKRINPCICEFVAVSIAIPNAFVSEQGMTIFR